MLIDAGRKIITILARKLATQTWGGVQVVLGSWIMLNLEALTFGFDYDIWMGSIRATQTLAKRLMLLTMIGQKM